MGGRGSFSYGGKRISGGDTRIGNGTPGLVAPDSRRDVRDAARAAGFRDVYNTSKIDREVMITSLDKVRELEKRYGAIGGSKDIVLNGVKDDSIAFVSRSGGKESNNQSLNFSLDNMGNAGKLVDMTQKAQGKGWFMPSGTTRKQLLGYTVTHEYGHMVQNVLYSKSKTTLSHSEYASAVRREIKQIATMNYGYRDGSKAISEYGQKNAKEFFAEAFANANSGRPNAIGKAMADWLKRKGFH